MVSDELYAKALYFVTNDRKASTSYIQRRLQIGYNYATALIERMEAEGHVGPANHVGKREILTGPQAMPAETIETSPRPAPDANEDEKTSGPLKLFVCSGCDAEAEAASDLPVGWYRQPSASLGMMLRCAACAKSNATKIATSTMSTEEILNFSGDDVISAAAQSRLKTIIERCQRLKEELAGISGDLKEVLDEAKGEGFDVKIIRRTLTYLSKDKVKRDEEDQLFDLYLAAIGER